MQATSRRTASIFTASDAWLSTFCFLSVRKQRFRQPRPPRPSFTAIGFGCGEYGFFLASRQQRQHHVCSFWAPNLLCRTACWALQAFRSGTSTSAVLCHANAVCSLGFPAIEFGCGEFSLWCPSCSVRKTKTPPVPAMESGCCERSFWVPLL